MKKRAIVVLALLPLMMSQRPRPPMPQAEFNFPLSSLWYIQSSEKIQASGEEISKPGFLMKNWYPASVPSTVLGALLQASVYQDPFTGKNLESIPEKPFQVSWWYRTEFLVEANPNFKSVRLQLDGLNYRADIWLNGKQVASADTVFGAFRRFDIDVTEAAKTGQKNILAVQVFPPKPGEPSIGFVDWNPRPPDGNMGIWREVRIRASGTVSIDNPFVRSRVDLKTLKEASLTISAEVKNRTAEPVKGTLEGQVEKITFSQNLELQPGETRTVVFSPETTPSLRLENPRLWWTHDLGKPELYGLRLAFKVKDIISDMQFVRFGIREVADYVNEDGHRGFTLNGKKILIRGGGWTDDIFLDVRPRKLFAEILYASHMNLNALRLEGFWGTSEALYNLCDMEGILLMAGWSCHWEWEHYFGKPTDARYGGILTPEDQELVAKSWRDQVRWLRNHPSIFVWAMASDLLPKPELEKEYRRILAEDDPTRPALVSTKDQTSEVSGPSRVKMRGPYDYVPPNYWYVDKENGGAFGFNTESGPGPQVPPLESLKRMIPEKDLWPINDVWYFHCNRGRFQNLERYNAALSARLGPPLNAQDYSEKAQFLNYEGMRAMYEAFVANKGKATGIIQWMYNSAWPKLWWQLYDYYLMPNGAFYGAKKACEPVHILYNYGTRGIVAANNTLEPVPDLKASIKMFGPDSKLLYSREIPLSLAAEEVMSVDALPEPEGVQGAYFLDLHLINKDKETVSVNFYALSTVPDVLDEAGATWYVTPVKSYADLTSLRSLPQAELSVKSKFSTGREGGKVVVEVENRSPQIAFWIEFDVVKDLSGDSVLPIFWDDNAVSLLPGEKRKIQGFFLPDDLGGEQPVLKVHGWNIQDQ